MNKVKQKQKILEWFKNMELRHDGYDIDMTYKRTTGGSRYGVYELHEGGEQYAE